MNFLMEAKPRLFFILSLYSVILWQSQAAIHKRLSRNVAEDGSMSIEALIGDLQRHTRSVSSNGTATGGKPPVTEAILHDSNNRGLVYYTGNDSQLIFVITYRIPNPLGTTQVYRSNDYGSTFDNINNIIANESLFYTLNISPEDRQRVYFLSFNRAVMYLSSDGGMSFTPRILSPNTIDTRTFIFHPRLEDFVLAKTKNSDDLYVTRDFGRTPFKKISSNVQDYTWGVSPFDADSSLFYYQVYNSSNTLEYKLYTQSLPYDESSRKEFDPSVGTHTDFAIVGRYIFLQKVSNNVVSLWVSSDRNPFNQAKIPSNDGHLNYIVDSIRSIQALVIIQHTNGMFNLYMSEEQGILYYLALTDLFVSDQFIIDLETIESMNDTTYIANQVVFYGGAPTENVLRTLISFDVGANWELLTPPTSSDTECIQPQCSLHLHMSTSEYWRTGVYSQESAPGIIIAHGATGQYLNDDNTNLFISRDGGSTWSQTLDGTWGVTVVDLGGLIVASHDYHNGVNEESSRILKYSCDEGISWSDLTFTNNSVVVFAVITEPGETTTVVSLYGINLGTNDWAIVTIDFDHIFPRLCNETDYYGWTPFDDNTDTGCLLGASVIVERHKPSVCCKNGKSYERVISYKACECSEEDFECDYGYKHLNGISGPCIRDEDIELSEDCGSDTVSFFKSQGYHKIGGDVCSGGVESSFTAFEAPCCNATTFLSVSTVTRTVTAVRPASSSTLIGPTSSSSSGPAFLTIILVVILAVCLFVIGIFIVAGIVIVIYKKKHGPAGYAAVPNVSYHTTYRDASPIGVSDDDDDPLPI